MGKANIVGFLLVASSLALVIIIPIASSWIEGVLISWLFGNFSEENSQKEVEAKRSV